MKNKILLLIVVLASILRLWHLSQVPPHLTSDEASLGYNAYSILKTGKDEYGKILPIIFKSFGDFKPGLYVYLTVPSVAIFGLNEFSTRFPSALAGILAVYILFFIVKELFGNKKLALASSFLLAIAPWHIHFSRGAWEVNVSLTLTLFGIYFFLKSFEKPKKLVLSALFFALTLFAYQGAKLSSSIVLVSLTAIYFTEVKKLLSNKKVVVSAAIVGLLVSLPIIVSLFQGKTGRLTIFSIFSYPRPVEYTQEFLDQGNEKIGSLSYYLFHSEGLNFARGIIGRWTKHYADRFLFFEGDWQNPRHSAPYSGMFVVGDILLTVLGFIYLVREKSKAKYLVLLWILLASLPAALTKDQVHAVRAFNLVIPLVIMNSFGLSKLIELLGSKKIVNKLIVLAAFIFYLATYVYYMDMYWVHLPKKDSQYWEYGYKQIVEAVTPIQINYDEIRVQQSFAQPYIYFLFYQKYDPAKYQERATLIESEYKGDVGYVEHLENIYFGPIDWSVNRGDSGKLFVADTIRIPPEDSQDENLFKIVKEINYLDGNPAFRIIEVK